MRLLTYVTLSSLAIAPTALAQAPAADARKFTFSAGLGPSHAFRGVDSRGIERRRRLCIASGIISG